MKAGWILMVRMVLSCIACCIFHIISIPFNCSNTTLRVAKAMIGMKVTGGDSSNKGCFGEKKNYSWNLESLPGIGKPGKCFGKYEIFSGHWAKIWYYMLWNNIYIQWYAPSVCAVFYVFWHLKTAELPMIWKDQSATFSTKIAWSSSAIGHVQSPADWPKNRTGARHILSVHTRSHHSLVQGYFYDAR